MTDRALFCSVLNVNSRWKASIKIWTTQSLTLVLHLTFIARAINCFLLQSMDPFCIFIPSDKIIKKKTSSWKESDRGTITCTDSSGIWGQLFAYLNDVCQDEKTPADSWGSHWLGYRCCSVDTGNICERFWAVSGKISLSAKTVLEATRPWEAQRSWGTILQIQMWRGYTISN